MDSINIVSDNKFLIKFRSSLYSGRDDYWTMVDRFGQIKPLPTGLENILKWSAFSAGASRMISTGSLMMLKRGEKKVLSLTTDA